MKIRATTPTRIDLAGGSLDLYPLYLFEDGGLTINCAVDIFCAATVETRSDRKVRMTSLDLELTEEYSDVDDLPAAGPLEIVARAVKFFHPATGLNVTTENRVRQGSGLGASSSLLMAVLASLNELTESGYSYEQLIDFAADLEAQCIRVPTGKQDYYAAMFGGISSLWFEVEGNRRESLVNDMAEIRELENRLVLSFTGAPRFSGATNWNIIKGYIEQDPRTVAGLKQIKKTASTVRACILDHNWDEFPRLIAEEWRNRRTLAEGVTNEMVDGRMKAALSAGAMANKLCGAGGGGCMITCVEPDTRSRVEDALAKAGAEVLPFRIVDEGIRIERLS